MCESIAHRGARRPWQGALAGQRSGTQGPEKPRRRWRLTETTAARTPQVPPGFDTAALPASLRLLWAAGEGEADAAGAGAARAEAHAVLRQTFRDYAAASARFPAEAEAAAAGDLEDPDGGDPLEPFADLARAGPRTKVRSPRHRRP